MLNQNNNVLKKTGAEEESKATDLEETKNTEQEASDDKKERDEEDEVGENWTDEVESFDNMALKEDLLRGIYAYGFKDPSIIQKKGIMPIVQGKDTIAQAQSGTGKTGTFSISMLQTIDINLERTQGIIVSPTRELSQQIAYVVHTIGEKMNVKVHVSCGGTDVR
jgi:translation initiation factor 4A